MKHLDPKQLPTAAPAKANKKPSTFGWLATITAFTIGLGAIGTWLFPVSRTDHVTQQEQDRRQSDFKHFAALSLPSIAANQIDKTLDAMNLSAHEREKLRALLVAGAPSSSQVTGSNSLALPNLRPALATTSPSPVRLVTVTLWDTHDEDGDVVAVMSSGYRREIVLTHAPQTVSFPVEGSSAVHFVGVHDGGGGITLGIRGPQQELLLPIMSEGQTIAVPVTP